jgi:hypothetical protein
MMVKVRTWSRDEFLAHDFDVDGYGCVSDGHYFIGRDVVSGYAIIDGNNVNDVRCSLLSSNYNFETVNEYVF